MSKLFDTLHNFTLVKLTNELDGKFRKRRILVFVNPVSGTGISLEIWGKAKHIFEKVDIDVTTIFTERKNHAYDVVFNLKIGEYDGIINCSGDGILHEIINGIFQREDRDIMINRTCFCSLPAGSANAFPKALTDYSNEDNRLETLCYFICLGKTKKVDIIEYELYDYPHKIYSFLTLTFGMVADIDLESEM